MCGYDVGNITQEDDEILMTMIGGARPIFLRRRICGADVVCRLALVVRDNNINRRFGKTRFTSMAR